MYLLGQATDLDGTCVVTRLKLTDDGSEDEHQKSRHRNRWLRVKGWM